MHIGIKLKELRKAKHLTQDQLAEQLGVKKHNLSDWEVGRSDPSIDHLIKIADYFNLSIQSILDLPILIQAQIPLELQLNYIALNPNNEVEQQLFSKLNTYSKEQLSILKNLIEAIKVF